MDQVRVVLPAGTAVYVEGIPIKTSADLRLTLDNFCAWPKPNPAAPQPAAPAVGMPWPLSLEQVRELLQEQRQLLLQDLRQAGVL